MDPAKLGGKPPVFELYDLENDRDEMHNLANDPAHRTELERMFAALKKWSAETNDPRLTDAFDKPPYINPDSPAMPKKPKGRKEARAGKKAD